MKVSILGDIKKKTIEILSVSQEKLTPIRIENELVKEFAEKKVVKEALRELILQGEIFYTYIHGSSFIERSINKPLCVSNHVILVPAGLHADCNPERVTIRIIHGGSFGNGQHPTTRISLRGIDFALSRGVFGEQELKKGALDIGTGSGVLAITAVKLGMKKAVGIDIDSIARKEALENVRVNGLTGQIEITDMEIDTIPGRFSLISANLRSPTLKQLVPHVVRMLIPRGVFVISGIREEELLSICDLYKKEGFHCIWKETETGWSGLVLERRDA
jgi:ribosomal protein L11 methyltransferase